MQIFWRLALAYTVVSTSVIAVAQTPDMCPMVIGITADGSIFTNSFQGWFRTSMKTLEAHLKAGCYPEGHPNPVSSVRLQIDPAAAAVRVRRIYDTLARAGWSREKMTVERTSHEGQSGTSR